MEMSEHLERLASAPLLTLQKRVDEISHLTEWQRKGWADLLSSIASSEGIESVVIRPLVEAFAGEPAALSFLQRQAEDEQAHQQTLKDYLRETFSFEKKTSSLTSRVVYQRIFPSLLSLGEKAPLGPLALIYFYETLSAGFYHHVQDRAGAAGLATLVEIFTVMEKDEIRHRKGIALLLGERAAKAGFAERAFARSLMSIARLEVQASWWAVYNRKVRENIATIGLNPDDFVQQAEQAEHATLALLSPLSKR